MEPEYSTTTPSKGKPESLTLSAPSNTNNLPSSESSSSNTSAPEPNPMLVKALSQGSALEVQRGKRPSTPLPDISIDFQRMESRRLVQPVKSNDRPANDNEQLLTPTEGPSRPSQPSPQVVAVSRPSFSRPRPSEVGIYQWPTLPHHDHQWTNAKPDGKSCIVCVKSLSNHDSQYCEKCHLRAHSGCTARLLTLSCFPNWPTTVDPALGRLHSFKEKPISRLTYCSSCTKIVHNVRTAKPGVVCMCCGIICHAECSQNQQLLHPCPPPFAQSKCPSQEHTHYMVLASTNKGTCLACQKKISSNMAGHLSQWRCYWCNIKVCSFQCHEQVRHLKCVIPQENMDLGLYILPTQFLTGGYPDIANFSVVDIPTGSRPFICFVHPKSGGCLGEGIIKRLSRLVNPGQVFNLMNGGPEPGLRLIMNNPHINFIVAACGGDGTAAWVFSVVDKLGMVCPPLAHCPLGTGNDLSRSLGWGPGMGEAKEMKSFIREMAQGVPMQLDRWKLELKEKNSDKTVEKVMNNYWSIGIDAKIALKFHEARQKDPSAFRFQSINKMWYATYGTTELLKGCPGLQKKIEVWVDDQPLDLLQFGELEGLVILNIPSCYGGATLWESKPKGDLKPQKINDGLFEVVGIRSSFHLGNCQTGLASPVIIAQGAKVVIHTDTDWPVQLDGEPWSQPPSVINISFHTKSTVLTKRNKAHSYILADQQIHLEMTEPQNLNNSPSTTNLTNTNAKTELVVLDESNTTTATSTNAYAPLEPPPDRVVPQTPEPKSLSTSKKAKRGIPSSKDDHHVNRDTSPNKGHVASPRTATSASQPILSTQVSSPREPQSSSPTASLQQAPQRPPSRPHLFALHPQAQQGASPQQTQPTHSGPVISD